MIVARCMKHIDHNKNAQLLEDMNSKNNQEESLGYGGLYPRGLWLEMYWWLGRIQMPTGFQRLSEQKTDSFGLNCFD